MSRDDDNGRSGTGCTIVLILCVVVLLCGGGMVALVGGGIYLARQQSIKAWEAEREAREQALLDQLRAMQGGEKPLPPGAHAVAIGPEGEIFWDDQPIDAARLTEILSTLAPAHERAAIPIYIRPGIGAPQETIDQVRELAQEYHEVVDPPPSPRIDLAPEPADEPEPPSGSKPQR